MKKKDLKQRGLGNKPNAAQPVETEDTGNMWSLEQYIEDKERQTKNRHGDDPTATKR
ncbi:unnamed protein product, partial [Pocillopora meandrina]